MKSVFFREKLLSHKSHNATETLHILSAAFLLGYLLDFFWISAGVTAGFLLELLLDFCWVSAGVSAGLSAGV